MGPRRRGFEHFRILGAPVTRFLVVPQWQGSASTRGMQLIDGALAIAGDLPKSTCTVIDVPVAAGDALATKVNRLSAVLHARDLTGAALAEIDADHVVIIGGDCGVSVAGISRALELHPDLAVVWFDAHGDLHTPESSISGAFGGMALRAVIGDGEQTIALSPGVAPDRVVLVGARDLDVAEADYLATNAITPLFAEDLVDPTALAKAVVATGASAVYVHVDLDVLDPADITGVMAPTPFGIAPAQLTAAIAELRRALPLAGATIAGFAPASASAAVDDLGVILRVVGALA